MANQIQREEIVTTAQWALCLLMVTDILLHMSKQMAIRTYEQSLYVNRSFTLPWVYPQTPVSQFLLRGIHEVHPHPK
jgi:hypothetical protein